jgi:hypothetical protein
MPRTEMTTVTDMAIMMQYMQYQYEYQLISRTHSSKSRSNLAADGYKLQVSLGACCHLRQESF